MATTSNRSFDPEATTRALFHRRDAAGAAWAFRRRIDEDPIANGAELKTALCVRRSDGRTEFSFVIYCIGIFLLSAVVAFRAAQAYEFLFS